MPVPTRRPSLGPLALLALAPLAAYANAINSAGVVCGFCVTADGSRAVIWRNGQVTDLNTLLPAGSPLTLLTATDISDAGVVAGTLTGPGLAAPAGFVMRY